MGKGDRRLPAGAILDDAKLSAPPFATLTVFAFERCKYRDAADR